MVGARDTRGYAREIAKLVDKTGPHVAFGPDIEGVGPNWTVNDCAGVRTVILHLDEMKIGADVIEQIAYRNYARVLKEALSARYGNRSQR